MAPNLNREKIAYRAQMEKEAAKKAAHDKKDRDKAALDKQRCVASLPSHFSSHPPASPRPSFLLVLGSNAG